jgi:hypothetical protein
MLMVARLQACGERGATILYRSTIGEANMSTKIIRLVRAAITGWQLASASVLVVACGASPTAPDAPAATTSAAVTGHINSAQEARMAYNFVKSVYDLKIHPGIPGNKSMTVSTQLIGGTGRASVVGSVSYTHSGSNLSDFTSTIIDVTSAFSGYADGGFVLNGSARYFDSRDSRSSCTSSGICASSSHYSRSNSATGLKVEFNYQGRSISDTITIDATSASLSSWTIKVISSNGAIYTWSA